MRISDVVQAFLTCAFFLSSTVLSYNNNWHFTYFPTPCYNATGISFRYYQGKYDQVYDSHEKTVPLLSQEGAVKADALGLDSSRTGGYVAQSALIEATYYNILTSITNVAFQDRSTFGYLLYSGKISFKEMYCEWRYQFRDNLYCSFMLPVFEYTFTNKGFEDLTPARGNGVFNKNNGNWNAFLTQYANILAGYGLQTDDYRERAVGDLCCGITLENLYKKENVVTLDGTIGLVVPLGKRERLDHIFSVDYGYKKQWGLQLGINLTSLFSHLGELQVGVRTIFFKDAVKTIRMYTDAHQQGFIKLAQGNARHDVGVVWNVYGTCQMQIPGKPLLALVGYSCNGQTATVLFPEDESSFKSYIVNNDPALKANYSHTVFAQLSYLKEIHSKKTPWFELCMVSFVFDYPFAGKNAVKGRRYGGVCGLVINFDF